MGMNARKLILLMLIIGLATSMLLYGCSNKKNPNNAQTNADTAETTTTDTTEEAATEDTATDTTEDTTEDTAVDADEDVANIAPNSQLTLSMSHASGVNENEFELEITCSDATEIYYTTDGSDPATSSTRMEYTTPIKIADRSNDENVISAVDPFLYDSANVDVNNAKDGFIYKLNSTFPKEAVDKCTVIRAVGFDKEGLYTKVATNTYFIGAMAKHIQGISESSAAANNSLAVISISINPEDMFDYKTGIYVKGATYDKALRELLNSGKGVNRDSSRGLDANYSQKGKEWERSIHMDLFESDGTSTTLALAQDCGIRIQGNFSRSDLQKGFRLFARSKYGNSTFEYPVFGDGLKNDADDTIDNFKVLTLRNGGNTAFTTKFSDTYWQSLLGDLDCDTQTSRPCVLYINGEYWGLYVLQEDYTQEYFETLHGVNKDDIVLYKGVGDSKEIEDDLGYKLDLGRLPEGVTDETHYYQDLLQFFQTHANLKDNADFDEFAKLVDVESARDYFAAQIWINNKWDWPGKNWSMWKTTSVDGNNPYADGKWRYVFYDVEFGGVMGTNDIYVNTIKDDGYEPQGLLDLGTENPAALVYAYLMTNESFRKDFATAILALKDNQFKKDEARAALDVFRDVYGPLYDQFYARYPGTGNTDNAIYGGYASYKCIYDFLESRETQIQPMLDYVDKFYSQQ